MSLASRLIGQRRAWNQRAQKMMRESPSWSGNLNSCPRRERREEGRIPTTNGRPRETTSQRRAIGTTTKTALKKKTTKTITTMSRGITTRSITVIRSPSTRVNQNTIKVTNTTRSTMRKNLIRSTTTIITIKLILSSCKTIRKTLPLRLSISVFRFLLIAKLLSIIEASPAR